MWAEAAEVVEEPHVEIAAVHHEVFGGEGAPEIDETKAGGEDVDEVDFTVDEKLEEADADFVVIHVVGLGIEGDFIDVSQGIKERREGIGLVDERETGRADGDINAKQAADGVRQETGDHLNCRKNVSRGAAEGESGNGRRRN